MRECKHFFYIFHIVISSEVGLPPHDFKLSLAIHLLQFNMRLYAGTYQGQLCLIEGTPSSLALRAAKQLSENSIRALSFSQGQLVAGGYDQELRVVNPLSAEQIRESKESQGIVNCIIQVSPTVTAVGLDNGHIRFWDVANWACKKSVKQHKKAVTDMQVDAKGLLLLSAAGKEVIFWSTTTLKSLYHYKFDFEINHILLVESFEYLFLLGERTLRQVSTQQNKELFRMDLNEKIQCGAVFLDFVLIATERGEVRAWKHGHYEHCIKFKAHEGRIKSMRIVKSEGIDCLVTAEANGEISTWDILEFLRGVEAVSQEYSLEGLKPLSSVKIKQRIICLQAISLEQPQEQTEKVEQKKEQKEEKEQFISEKAKKRKQKKIQKKK